MTLRRSVSLVAVLACAGVAMTLFAAEKNKLPDDAAAVLRKAEQLEIYSLEPNRENVADGFHGWRVLGTTTVKNAKGKDLLDALDQGIKANEGEVAACFNPRHGIRAKAGESTVDVVICFECLSLKVISGGKNASVLTTRSPQGAFDKVLKEAGVPLPKAAE
jgi:hypothetical protein